MPYRKPSRREDADIRRMESRHRRRRPDPLHLAAAIAYLPIYTGR